MNFAKREFIDAKSPSVFHQQIQQQIEHNNTFLHAEQNSLNNTTSLHQIQPTQQLPQQPEPQQQAPNTIDAMLNGISHVQFGDQQLPKQEP